jgi:hypothetical protein
VNCQKALGYQFEKKSTVESFSILTTSIELFELYCTENNINLAMDEVFDQIAEHMKNGECISDLEGIVDLFKDCIISLVSSDHLNLLLRKSRNKILKKNPAYPTIFYDEDHIYLSRDDLIQYIIPMYSIDIIPDDILHALKEEGYLCTYNMGKFTYEVKPSLYDECGMRRCSMIKISRNLFDEVGSFSIFDGGDI